MKPTTNTIPLIYLDASATTPPLEEVLTITSEVQATYWGNPSSLHTIGINALTTLETARCDIANLFSADPNQIIFTSGATESIYLALEGFASNHSKGRIVISSVEHPSVVRAANKLTRQGWKVELWPVDDFGRIDDSYLDEMLEPPTKIVSLIWGQSEIGTIQPIHVIGEECRKRGIAFHSDATQVMSQGFFNFNCLPVDFVSASLHKLRGPKGVGILFIKDPSSISALFEGGDQEGRLRSGTQSVHLAAGAAIALNHIVSTTKEISGLNVYGDEKVRSLTKDLRSQLNTIENLEFTGHPVNRLPNHISMILRDKYNKPVNGRDVVRALSRSGVCASSGTACKSGSSTDSPVLKAINIEKSCLKSGLRFSLGEWLSAKDLENIPNILSTILTNLSH